MVLTHVINIRKFGADKAIILLQRPQGFSYLAGQYVSLTFEGCEPRFYSIANAPGMDSLEIHIKDNGKGGAGTYALKDLHVNEPVLLDGPFGDVVLKEVDKRPLLLIAGGMGVSPFKALAEEAVFKGLYNAPMTLFWGVETEEDRYVHDILLSMSARVEKFKYVSIVGGAVGDRVVDYYDDLSHHHIYLSGSPDMIIATLPLVTQKGALPKNISSDHKSLLMMCF